MSDKIISLGSKGILIIFVVVGVVLSGIVMSYGNPYGLNKEETDALGLEIAKAENAQENMSQVELNAFIEQSGLEKKNELLHAQGEKVVTTTNFTLFIMGFAVFLILVALVLGIIQSPKQYLFGIIGMVAFVILIFIIYSMSGEDIPAELVAGEAEKLVPEDERLFTGGNWKIAGASMMSMIVLLVMAVVTWVGSEAYKLIKG